MADPMPIARRPAAAPTAAAKPAGPTHAAPASGSGVTPSAPQFSAESEVHLLDRLAVLYRYRRLCISVFILVTTAMIIQGYSSVQLYQAQGRLLIEDERSTAIPGLQNDQNTFYEDPEPYYQTQYKILKGRDLMRRVVHKLHLETVPEFNGTKPAPPTPTSLLGDLKTRIVGYFGTPEATTAAEKPKVDESADES